MKTTMDLLGRIHLNDRRVALAGIALSVFSIAFLLFRRLDQTYIFPVVLVFVACAAWLLIRRVDHGASTPPRSGTVLLVLGAVFFVLFTASILTYHFRPEEYERPLLFFVLMAMMAGTIAAEVLFAGPRAVPLLLAQAIILAVELSWSQNLLFPNVVYIDSWIHQSFTNAIVTNAHIPGNFGYSQLPLFHLLLSQTEIMLDVDFKSAQMLLAFCLIVIQVSFTYVISSMLFKSRKAALFSALATTFAVWVVGFNIAPVPTTLGFSFVIMTVYFLLKRERLTTNLMMVFFTFAIVWTHTIASVCMLVILVAGYVGSRIRWSTSGPNERFGSLVYIIFFSAVMVAWWSQASFPQAKLAELFQWGFSRDVFITSGERLTHVVPLAESLFILAGIYIFYALAFIGVLHAMSRRGSAKAATVAMMGVVTFGIGFVALVAQLAFLQDRWWYYSQYLLAIPLGAALCLLFNLSVKRRSGRARWPRKVLPYLLVSVTVASLTFLAIMNPQANVDNHTFSPSSSIRYAVTESELTGAAFVADHAVGNISTDYDFGLNPSSSIFTNFLDVEGFRVRSLNGELRYDNWTSNGAVKVVRTYITDNPFHLGGWTYELDYDLAASLRASDLNRVYVSASMSAYI